MEELLVGAFLFVLGLLIWAAVGHWIWLALSATVRGIFGYRCANCGHNHFQAARCPNCAKQQLASHLTAQPTPERDLEAAQRLLRLSRFKKWLPDLQLAELTEVLDRLSKRLATGDIGQEVATGQASPTERLLETPRSETQLPQPKIIPADVLTTPPLVKRVRPADFELPETAAVARPHALDANYDEARIPKLALTQVRQRVTADLLKSFMEQSNIRWIELISGAMIVICSVGLVISLWSTLSGTSRFFPSLVFLLATLAVHGAGQYTLRRWKLRTTSRGILHIGLMLIPLSVLVGILLARRDAGPPALDAMTFAVIAAGSLVYGALSITASLSLFGRRWLLPSLATILGSVLLVPIFALGQLEYLEATSASWLLAPIVAVSMWSALSTSRSVVRRAHLADGKARVLTGIAIQSIFAAVVAFVFWRLQAREGSSLSPGWWLMAAGASAAWASWGWAISLTGLVPHREQANHVQEKALNRPNWLVITGWCLASMCSLFLLASLWQVAADRAVLMCLLVLLAIWWTIHGWLCNIRASLLAGALAAICGLTIGSELFHAPVNLSLAIEWLSFSRVAALTAVGLVSVVVSSWFRVKVYEGSPRAGGGDEARVDWWGHESATISCMAQQFTYAGGIAVFAAALLTVVASFVSLGATPYGGNWASVMLLTYGVIAIVGAIVSRRRGDLPQVAVQWMMPLGQAVMLLGTIRLCQTSPMLATTLASLRPARAWAVGLALLSPSWAVLAAAIRNLGAASKSRDIGSHPTTGFHVNSLCGGSILSILASSLAIWTADDHLRLASVLGWTLPLTTLGLLFGWRLSHGRDATLLALFAWLGSLTYWIGLREGAWEHMTLATSTAVFVAVATGLTLAFDGLFQFLQFRVQSKAMESAADPHWLVRGPFWAAPLLLWFSWICLLLTVLAPAGLQLGKSLGFDSDSVVDPFIVGQVESTGAGFLLTVAFFLTAVSAWVGYARSNWSLTSSTALLPLFSALTISVWVGTPQALIAALWVLAGWIVLSEFISLGGAKLAAISKHSWRRLISDQPTSNPQSGWLVLGRSIAIVGVLAGTSAMAIVAWTGNAPVEEYELTHLLWVFGPLMIVSLVRWLLSLREGEEPKMMALSGGVAAVTLGCLASIVVQAGREFPISAILFLQTTALASSILAWFTVGFTLLRNAIGLRALLGAKAPLQTLLPKSVRGARWKKSESAARSLNTVSVAMVVCLCLAATVAVLVYPMRIVPELAHLGGLLATISFLTTVCLFWFLSIKQEVSRFGLLAISLGMLAPLASATYATWLAADPSRSFSSALSFEPVRSLVGLWLVALSIGLVVRIVATQAGRSLSGLGQWAWVMLASVVASIALVCTVQDPNPWWPFAELSLLALIMVLSGCAANQPWRGHLAAVAAAAALSSWVLHPGQRDAIESFWLVLWGPVWVASIAQIWSLKWPRSAPAPRIASVDQSASLHVPIFSIFMSLVWLVLQPNPVSPPALPLWTVVGLSIACLALSVLRLWDQRQGKRGLSVYLSLLSLSAVLTISLCSLGELPKLQTILLWMTSVLGAMAVMAGLLRELVRESSRLGPALKLGSITHDRAKYQHALHWMCATHTIVALLALVPSIVLVLSLGDRTMRIAATVLPLLGSLAIMPIAIEGGKAAYRYVSLLLTSVTLVLLWWADLPNAYGVASLSESWIYWQRLFVALISLAMIYLVSATWLSKKPHWVRPLMDFSWLTLVLGIMLGGSLLLGQFIGPWAVETAGANHLTKLMSIGAWIAIAARLLQFAAQPTSTDRNAGIPLRKFSVYVAELAIAALCGAIYGSYPHLFSGLMAAWWPIVMFAVAILSAAIGEWLQRIKQPIIADPVQQSSLLLPLIPLAGVWWFSPGDLPWMWSDWDRYSILLLSAAGLYGIQGWVKESVGLRILSVFFVLASFWSFLHSQPTLRFFEHPQFWLLPPALASLAFVEFNRRRFDPKVVVATRYIAILVAYLSSTAEIFLKAFEGSLWQPLLLLILALCGVAAGIFLRVRAFLFCGSAFTFVALLGMVWHAQQAIGQVWPWWAFGIATGVGLIALLGYFEKNRPRVLAYVDKVKRWESQ